MHGPLFPQKAFTAAPHTFHTLCVCSSSWVHKMNGVIDCLVCCLSNSSVGGPFITEHYTARTNILLDEREECGGISVLNLHQEALSYYSFGPPKHPVTFNLPASVVLSFAKFTLINLYFNSWTSNDGRVIYKILGTDVPYNGSDAIRGTGNSGSDGSDGSDADVTGIRGMVLPGMVLSHTIESGDQAEAVFSTLTCTGTGIDDGKDDDSAIWLDGFVEDEFVEDEFEQ